MKKMTEEWALLWVQCLSQNMDYCCYCIHNDADDEDEDIAELDLKFPMLADIYKDFGDEQSWPTSGIKDARWRKWFDAHRHLFLPDVKEIKELNESFSRSNTVLLSIPLQSNLDETLYAVKEFLRTGYDFSCRKEIQSPKYQLKLRDGRPAVGYEQVRQAVITSTDKVLDDKFLSKDNFTVKDATIGFLQRNIDRLGWSLDPRAKNALLENGVLSDERYEAFKTMINRCRKDFKLLSANTVRGSFPDLTPFESRSWDSFKGASATPGVNR